MSTQSCIFIELCKNGDLDQIKEFYNKHHNEINISYNYNQAFQLACENGCTANPTGLHLEVAKWLLSIPNN